ncbi:MAG: twin-arginine translocase TatA/TatE family subunit [Terracidiphilus sp.]
MRTARRRPFVSGLRGQVSLLSMVAQPAIELATVGWADSVILMVLALVVFGPRRLPQIARQMGKLMYEFRKASNDFKFQMEEELRAAEDADRRKAEEARLRALALPAPAQPPADSQVSEARPGAPATDAAGPTANGGTALAIRATAETPSWEESAYPPSIAPADEAPGEETYPRIQPPSTGEQVPAAKPWNLEEELAKVSGVAAEPEGNRGAGVEGSAEAAEATDVGQPEETAPATEPARHG